MKDFENMSNNDILKEIKQMEADYEGLKTKMLNDFSKMEEIELNFEKANNVLTKRNKID